MRKELFTLILVFGLLLSSCVNPENAVEPRELGSVASDHILVFELERVQIISNSSDESLQSSEIQILVFLLGEDFPIYSYPGGAGYIRLGEGVDTMDLSDRGPWVRVPVELSELCVLIVVFDTDEGEITGLNLLDDVLREAAIAVVTQGLSLSWQVLASIVAAQIDEVDNSVLEKANDNYIGSALVTLRESEGWNIGRPVNFVSSDGHLQLTYQVHTTRDSVLAENVVIITATPSIRNPTPTLENTSPKAITILSENSAINLYDSSDLILIPPGDFLMGLTESEIDFLYRNCSDCEDNVFIYSDPQHSVYLSDYWINKTEVTVQQYKLCVSAGFCSPPHKLSSATVNDYYNNPMDQEAPVIYVDWNMASAYCHWAGGRLPTEAEWEKAARGTEGSLFPWGDTFPNTSWANFGRHYGDVTYVGKFRKGASPYGVLDMAGNVYEWVSDWFHGDYFQFSPYENPQGPDNLDGSNVLKVVKGGSWFWSSAIAVSGFHDQWEMNKSGNGVGFRCVVDAD